MPIQGWCVTKYLYVDTILRYNFEYCVKYRSSFSIMYAYFSSMYYYFHFRYFYRFV